MLKSTPDQKSTPSWLWRLWLIWAMVLLYIDLVPPITIQYHFDPGPKSTKSFSSWQEFLVHCVWLFLWVTYSIVDLVLASFYVIRHLKLYGGTFKKKTPCIILSYRPNQDFWRCFEISFQFIQVNEIFIAFSFQRLEYLELYSFCFFVILIGNS